MTPAQISTLRADILAQTDPAFVALRNAGESGQITDFYNAMITPATYCWRATTPVDEIFDGVTWANLTPNAVPPTVAADAEVFTARALKAQAKQLNLQIMLQGRQALTTGKVKIRDGLQDALTGLPTAIDGSDMAAGWPAVKAIITRTITRAERLFATGTTFTQANPGTLGAWEGMVSNDDVLAALRG